MYTCSKRDRNLITACSNEKNTTDYLLKPCWVYLEVYTDVDVLKFSGHIDFGIKVSACARRY